MEDFAKKRYAPVGRCIYCGSKEELSDEHIIPYSLSGPTVLPDSSCKNCGKITGAVEGIVLREHAMRAVKSGLGFKSRRPKEAPTTSTLRFVKEGKEQTVVLSLSEHPLFLVMLEFSPPQFISNVPYKNGVVARGYRLISFGKNPDKVAKDLETKTITWKQISQPVAFARMVAKIAYAFAVGEKGLDSFEEVFVIPAILGHCDDIGRWVGSQQNEAPKYPGVVHRLSCQVDHGSGIVSVIVHLFSNSDSPSYLVIVGRLKKELIVPDTNCKQAITNRA